MLMKCEETDFIQLLYKGNIKARKDQVWPIFTHFSILISGQMLLKSIASCRFSGMILVPHHYFQGQKCPIYWGFFQGQKGPI